MVLSKSQGHGERRTQLPLRQLAVMVVMSKRLFDHIISFLTYTAISSASIFPAVLNMSSLGA